MTLAEKLAMNLGAHGGNLTQKVFARKLGISRATFTHLENSGQNTTLNTLDQKTKSLRCDVGDLFQV